MSSEIDHIADVDLLLVMGTSLQVAPFCALPNIVRKNCCRVYVDKNPSIKNNFSKSTNCPTDFYGNIDMTSFVKFGKKHAVTLRPQWSDKHKYKNQFVIVEDVDKFAKKFMDLLDERDLVDKIKNNLKLN